MSDSLQGIPKALVPPVDLEGPASDVHLYSGEVIVHLADKKLATEAEIVFRWLPRPRVTFELESLPINLEPGELRDIDLEIPEIGVAGAQILRQRLDLSNGKSSWSCAGVLWNPPPWPAGFRADRLRFLVPNYHRYDVGGPVTDGNRIWSGRLKLRSERVTLVVDQLENAGEAIELLRQVGGYAATHVAELQVPTGESISQQKADELLAASLFFLSFSRGLWTSYILPVALSQGARQPYWRVSAKLKQWRGVSSWFPRGRHLREEELSRSFSRFIELSERNLWRDPLTWAIHWYVEANCDAGGREGALILAQAALELLGWLVLVEDPETARYGDEKFNGQRAAWKTRRLLEHCGIDAAVPSHLEEARGAARALRAHDGPSLITELRHALVHPRQEGRNRIQALSSRASLEVRQLALMYVELVILRILDYQGLFLDRTVTRGDVESACRPVPWA